MQVSHSTDYAELLGANPWLKSTKLVVKPDMLFGKRGKHDLVGLNLDFAGVEQFIKARMNKQVGAVPVTQPAVQRSSWCTPKPAMCFHLCSAVQSATTSATTSSATTIGATTIGTLSCSGCDGERGPSYASRLRVGFRGIEARPVSCAGHRSRWMAAAAP